MLETEFNYFKAHQDELVKKYNNKILIIRGNEVVGTFNNNKEAYNFGTQNFGLGNFMLQKCIPGPEAYTVTISSNVVKF